MRIFSYGQDYLNDFIFFFFITRDVNKNGEKCIKCVPYCRDNSSIEYSTRVLMEVVFFLERIKKFNINIDIRT